MVIFILINVKYWRTGRINPSEIGECIKQSRNDILQSSAGQADAIRRLYPILIGVEWAEYNRLK